MPTARVAAHTTAQALFTTPKHVVGRITGINIDNQSGAARTIRIQDVFTPDASVGVPVPVAQTIERFQITVATVTSVQVPDYVLKDIRMLGAAKAIADAIAATCIIVVNYSFE